MKILGLVGGTSWVSTIDYYRYINEGVNQQLGGPNYANCLLYSFNFADIKQCLDHNDWEQVLKLVTNAAANLKQAGAEAIVLCANTLHIVAEGVERNVGLPVIHIAEVTAEAIKKQQLKKVGLLGTKFTMQHDFFKLKLKERGIETLVPAETEFDFIQNSITTELYKGVINPETKAKYIAICNQLIAEGAEGIILGCTEIPLLLKPEDLSVPSFDTTAIHAAAAVQFALSKVVWIGREAVIY